MEKQLTMQVNDSQQDPKPDNENPHNNLISQFYQAPLTLLGLQENEGGYLTHCAFYPNATEIVLINPKDKKTIASLEKIDSAGLFYAQLKRKKPFAYQLKITQHGHTDIVEDPFRFSPTLGDMDLHLLCEGNHQKPYDKLGAHYIEHQGVQGVSFAVWAPNASGVAVIGDFNDWHGLVHPLKNVNFSGYWNIFVPAAKPGQSYKFEIKDSHGNMLEFKSDPYGIQAQYRPDTASVISMPTTHKWQDKDWLAIREQRNSRQAPISIYEVHLGSWKRKDNNEFLNYRELADQLVPYALEMGFTHLQLMPVSEHPFDGSWGYQPIGLFAPTARFGDANDFQYFVDQCHQHNLGLLVDWVPGHFPNDGHGLAKFDGTHLYEHADPRQGYHPDWDTLIYNYGRTEVANFLRSSAFHWLDKYHVDGVRVDAVASMLYLDYSREEGQWLPNRHGGRENLEAVDFLKRFNAELYAQYPGTFSVAEESTSWPGVSHPTDMGGLGFGYKWNMGWMNDSLEYIKRDPIYRQHHHNELSFSLVYAFHENFILPLSHDEVVHGKGSILDRMPGDAWQKFANLRAFYGYMWAHPGKKLLFMGCEFGQGREWDHDQSLDWHQLDIDCHQGVQRLIRDLNAVYKNTPALHQKDCEADGFAWIDHGNHQQSIYSFIRYGEDRSTPVIAVCNFTPTTHHDFKLGVPVEGQYQELLNSDSKIYGGSGQGNPEPLSTSAEGWQGQPHAISITVPPLSTVIFTLSNK